MKKALIILMFALIVVSCRADKDHLSIAVSSEPSTLDMHVNTSLIARTILVGNVYEKLFVLDQDGDVRCELAEDYALSEDGRSLSISIRDNVKFHNGEVMDVEDVIYSMNRYLDYYGTSELFVGDSRFTAIDEKTIEITADNSLALFPYLIASSPQSAVIVPAETLLDDILSEGIGTGPYCLSSWKSGEYIELKKFDGYISCSDNSDGIWGKKSASIPTLRYLFVPDAVTRRLGLESGLYDFINDVMSQDAKAFESNKDIELLSAGESGMIALVFNKKEGLSTNLDFRKAASMLFDSENIMRACYGDRGYSTHPNYMEIEQSEWISGKDNPYFAVNEIEARALLDGCYNGEKVRILTSNLSNLDKLALAVASDLKKGGVDAEVIAVDWATMLEMRKDSSSWDIFISAFSQVPLPILKSFLNPTFPGWIGEEETELLSSVNSALTLDEAVEAWKSVEPKLWEALPAYVPGHYSTEYASSSNLDGVIVQNGFYFWNAKFI